MRSLRLVRVSRILRLLRAIRVIRELRMMVFSIMSSLNAAGTAVILSQQDMIALEVFLVWGRSTNSRETHTQCNLSNLLS